MKTGTCLRAIFILVFLYCAVLLPGATAVRFGIVTDIHYADRDAAGTRFYRESCTKLAEFVGTMNREKPDFIVELGDFKDQEASPDPIRTMDYLSKVESVFAGFHGRRFHVLGNHDQDSVSKAEFLGATENSGIKGKQTYYSFDAKGTHFIVLDANYRSDSTDYNRGNFDWTDAAIPATELQWLKQDLDKHRKRTIVLAHQQLDGEGAYYVKNAASVRAALESSGQVSAVFQGHRHEGAYSRIRGIHYYTLKGLIEGSGAANNAYALVTAEPDGTIRIKGYGTVASCVYPGDRLR